MANKINIDPTALGISWSKGSSFRLAVEEGLVVGQSDLVASQPNDSLISFSVFSTGPTYDTITPAAGAVDVGITELVMVFDRTVYANTGNFYLRKTSDNSLIQQIAINSSYINDNIVTLPFTAILLPTTSYYVEFDDNVLVDISGFYMISAEETTNWSFTTYSMDPILSPVDNSIGVNAVGVSLTFPHNITANTGTIQLWNGDSNTLVESFDVNINVSIVGNTASVTFTNPLGIGVNYYLLVSNGAFVSDGNVQFNGFSANTDWNFITDSYPVVTSVYPGGGETNIGPDTDLVITFDQNVKAGSNNVYIKRVSDNQVDRTIAGSEFVFVDNTATFTNLDISPNVNYYVSWDSAAFLETDNDYPVAGLSGTTYNFTTAPAPSIVSSNLSILNRTITLSVTYDRAVTAGNPLVDASAVAILYKEGQSDLTAGASSVNSTTLQFQFTVGVNDGLKDYYILLGKGVAVSVDFGITSLETTNVNQFTITTSGPELVSSDPVFGSDDIPVATDFSYTFSEPVIAASPSSVILTLNAVDYFEADFTGWGTTTITSNFSYNLAYGTTINATIVGENIYGSNFSALNATGTYVTTVPTRYTTNVRTYTENETKLLFPTDWEMVGENDPTNPQYTVELSWVANPIGWLSILDYAGTGTHQVNYSTSPRTLTLTGTRAEVNDMLSYCNVSPVRDVTTNSSITYKQYKNVSELQTTATITVNGVVQTQTIDGEGFHIFNTPGTHTFDVTFDMALYLRADMLLLGAGGGGGGARADFSTGTTTEGGGGGAGALYLVNNGNAWYQMLGFFGPGTSMVPGQVVTMQIDIGAGGVGGITSAVAANATRGQGGGLTELIYTINSTNFDLFVRGGGGGGSGGLIQLTGENTNEASAGGGGTYDVNTYSGGSVLSRNRLWDLGGGAVGPQPYSNDGGVSDVANGGGGGGALNAGLNGVEGQPRNGGNGIISNVTGTNVEYGRGGNGNRHASNAFVPTTQPYGGGDGGGAVGFTGYNGANGADGLVAFRLYQN